MSDSRSASDNQDRLGAAETIERLGGIRPAAAKLGIAVTTVQGWKTRGRIPDNRHEMVRAAAAKHGIDLEAAVASPAAAKADEPSAGTAPSELPKAPPAPDAGKDSGTKSGKTPDAKPDGAVRRTAFGAGPIALTTLFLAGLAIAAAIFLPFSGPDPKTTAQRTPPAGLASVEKPAVEKPAVEKPAVEKPAVEKPAVEKPAVEKPAVEKKTVKTKPMAAKQSAAGAGRADSGGLEGRIATLEAGLETLKARPEGVSEADLGALKADIERTAKQLDGLAGRVAAVADQVAKGGTAVAGKASSAELDGLRREAAILKATLAAMSAEQAALSARVAELSARPVAGRGASGALALAVGQLDAALDSGKPYKAALDRVRAMAGEDAVAAGALAPLGLRAERGIPTRAELHRRLGRLLPDLAAAAPKGREDGMFGKIWSRLAAIVVIRRIADGEPGKDASPATRAEAAFGKGDLVAAEAALDGYGGAVEAWRRDVRERLAAEASVATLRDRALRALAAPSTAAAK